jgi:hypothetical protein
MMCNTLHTFLPERFSVRSNCSSSSNWEMELSEEWSQSARAPGFGDDLPRVGHVAPDRWMDKCLRVMTVLEPVMNDGAGSLSPLFILGSITRPTLKSKSSQRSPRVSPRRSVVYSSLAFSIGVFMGVFPWKGEGRKQQKTPGNGARSTELLKNPYQQEGISQGWIHAG